MSIKAFRTTKELAEVQSKQIIMDHIGYILKYPEGTHTFDTINAGAKVSYNCGTVGAPGTNGDILNLVMTNLWFENEAGGTGADKIVLAGIKVNINNSSSPQTASITFELYNAGSSQATKVKAHYQYEMRYSCTDYE
jgi:hypothetical protein